MAITNAVSPQGEAPSGFSREKALKALTKEYIARGQLCEVPEAMRCFDHILEIAGYADSSEAVGEVLNQFTRWDLPRLITLLADGMQLRLDELFYAQDATLEACGITHVEILDCKKKMGL